MYIFSLQNTYEHIASETKFQLLLTNVVNKTASENARTMAAVLLRRLLTTNFDEVFPTVSVSGYCERNGILLENVINNWDSSCPFIQLVYILMQYLKLFMLVVKLRDIL